MVPALRYTSYVAFLLLCLLPASRSEAQSESQREVIESSDEEKKSSDEKERLPPIRVGTRETAPFSYKLEGKWTGIAIELWREIAAEMDREFEIEELPLPQIFERLQRGDLDIAVGAISMSAEREIKVDFSHAFFGTGLGIATRYDANDSWGAALSRLKSSAFLKAMGALLLVLVLASLLVYIFERKKNADDFGGTIPEAWGRVCGGQRSL